MIAGEHRKLLVVDDEPLVRETLDYCLRDEYEVTAVASGEEAIEASLKEDFPVVILDLCMEGISGIETLKKLKQIRQTQNVIILTAYESTETAIMALNSGAFNYLTKPFERSHLKEVIHRGFEVYDRQSLRTRDMEQRLLSVHDSFLSLLCHEFNTPLNVILGFSELLTQEISKPDQVEMLRDIRQSGTHLHDILMEIVDYIGSSHLAAGGIENDFVPQDLFQPIIQTFREREVAVNIAADPAATQKYRGADQSVLMIARKMVAMASHQSKNVSIDLHLEHDAVSELLKMTVGGTGLYRSFFDQAEIEQLFEPYKYLPGGTGNKLSLGLELATCRKIAEYANGTVDCVPNLDGELEFTAHIPVRLIG